MATWKLGFSLVDAFARITTRSFILEAADYTAAATLTTQFTSLYQDVTELHLFETRLVEEDAIAGAPIGGSNVDAGMSITAQLATPNKKASIQIPSPVAAVINPDGTIDVTGTEMAALLVAYTQATNYITASDGEVVTAFIKGVLDK